MGLGTTRRDSPRNERTSYQSEERIDADDHGHDCNHHTRDLVERFRKTDVSDEPPEKPADEARDDDPEKSPKKSAG